MPNFTTEAIDYYLSPSESEKEDDNDAHTSGAAPSSAITATANNAPPPPPLMPLIPQAPTLPPFAARVKYGWSDKEKTPCSLLKFRKGVKCTKNNPGPSDEDILVKFSLYVKRTADLPYCVKKMGGRRKKDGNEQALLTCSCLTILRDNRFRC